MSGVGLQSEALTTAQALPRALDRRFEAVIFDWDGTAVPDRSADASELRALVEELCLRALDLVVITGTHVGNVDEQLCARPAGPGRLYFCVNRGSKVYAANEEASSCSCGARRLRTRTQRSNAAAAATVAELGRHGLIAAVVSRRVADQLRFLGDFRVEIVQAREDAVVARAVRALLGSA